MNTKPTDIDGYLSTLPDDARATLEELRRMIKAVTPDTVEATNYRNPISLAREWEGMLGAGECSSRAGLARKLGVTRARVTQILGLLDLAPEVREAVVGLGDPLSTPVVTDRSLRPLRKLPAEEQGRALLAMAPVQRK